MIFTSGPGMRLWRQGAEPVPAHALANEQLREQRALQELAAVEASDPDHWNRSAELASALIRLAGAQGSLGNFDEAVTNSSRAVHLIRTTPVQSSFELSGMLIMTAQWLLLRGDVGEAEVLALEVHALAETIDDVGIRHQLEGGALEFLVAIHFAAGDLERAETAAHRRMDFADIRRVPVEESGQDRAHLGDVTARVHLGQIRLAMGDRQGAVRYYDDALEVIDRFYGHDIRTFPGVLAKERVEIAQLRSVAGGRSASEGLTSMTGAVAVSVRTIVDLLVEESYGAVEAITEGRRLSAEDLRGAVETYSQKLAPLPASALEHLDVVEVDNAHNRPTFHVAVDLWTLEEGRSDLTLELRLTEIYGGTYDIEVLDLHVLL